MTNTVVRTDSGARLEHYRQRIRDLGQVVAAAGCDRDLAIFRAHQCGATQEDLARLALVDVAEVAQVIDSLRREPEIDEWSDGPDWVRLYRTSA